MSGPAIVNPRGLAMGTLEELEKRLGAQGWDYFEQQFMPAQAPAALDPGDSFKRRLAAWADTELGRETVNWILDLTCRAPYPVTSQGRDDLAFAAAKHQSRAAVGEVIVKAIAEGRAIQD